MDAWEGDDDEMVELVRAAADAADAGVVVDVIPWTRVVVLMTDLKGAAFEVAAVAVAVEVVWVDASVDYYYSH